MSGPWAGLTPPYRTIVADPPWAYRQNAGRILTSANRTETRPDIQYERMTIGDIASLDVAGLADSDAHLYLWVTNPLLPDVWPIIERWGFRYVTAITWRKLGALGMGFYFRGDTEHILFAVRGQAPIAPEDRVRNWFEAKKRRHSVKPAAFYDLVEQVSPGPYVELFARQPRLGWDSWGWGYEQQQAASR